MRDLGTWGTILRMAAGFALAAGSLHASVIYSFAGKDIFGAAQSFVLTVPTFLNPQPGGPFIFTCGQLDLGTCVDSDRITFANTGIGQLPELVDIDFNYTLYPYQFAARTFGTAGVYQAMGDSGNTAILTVSVNAPAPLAGAPEPAAALLTVGGLALCCLRGWRSRRPARRVSVR